MERAGRALNQAQAQFRAGSLQLQGHRATKQVLLASGAICMETGNIEILFEVKWNNKDGKGNLSNWKRKKTGKGRDFWIGK